MNSNRPPNVTSALFYVAEDIAPGSSIATLNGNDPDLDNIAYSIAAGDVDGLFNINEVTGTITYQENSISSNGLNFERVSDYTLVVQAVDDSTNPLETYAVINITVLDVNEPPVLKDEEMYVVENTFSATVALFKLFATDPDANEQLLYSLEEYDLPLHTTIRQVQVSGAFNTNNGTSNGARPNNIVSTTLSRDSMPFKINAGTGEIFLRNRGLDYEEEEEYTISTRVTDSGFLQSDATLKIHVKDVNEAPILSDNEAYVPENSIVGITVGEPMAFFDQDYGQSYEFSIEEGNEDGIFSIDNNGQITVLKDNVDYESDSMFALKIKITDSGVAMNNRLSDTATMTIHVIDVNEAPTFPFGSNRVRYVPEKSSGGTLVGDAVAALDIDQSQSIRYSMKQLNLADSEQCPCSYDTPC
jgi:hypothetical protein